MGKNSSVRFVDSRSDNRKSKTCGERSRTIQNRKLVGIVTLAVIVAMCGVVAQAQQPTKIPRIGFLIVTSPSDISARIEAFRQGLRELRYVEGKNIVIEYRSAEGKPDRLPAVAAELVRLKVDLIVTTGPSVTRAAKEATVTIPIVMTNDNDPVGWVRRQSGPPGREHHWLVHACPGTKRQTTGASEGDLFLNSPAWLSSGLRPCQATRKC